MRELKTPQDPTAKAERPEEGTQAEHREEEWNAMQMEDEDSPGAGAGMDDADEVLRDGPPQGERTTENVIGRRWGLPHGCSEPRPRQGEIRITDEVSTVLTEAALENEQDDKAMAAMGIAQNLNKEETVVVARGGGSMSVLKSLAQASRQGDSSKQPNREQCCQACALLQVKWKLHRERAAPVGKMSGSAGMTSPSIDEEKLGRRAEHASKSDQSLASRAWNCATSNGAQNPTGWAGPKG